MTVAYFDHNRECRLEILGGIILCDIVLYVFVGTTKKNHFSVFLLKGTGDTHISDIIFK